MARTYTGPRRAEQLARKRQVLKTNRTLAGGRRATSEQIRTMRAQVAILSTTSEED